MRLYCGLFLLSSYFEGVLFASGAAVTSTPPTPSPSVVAPAIESRSLEEIYEAAQREKGALRVAWGGDVLASQEIIVKAFKQRFPKVQLNLTVDLSKYWDTRIDRAHETTKGKDNVVDVAVLQCLHDFPRWKEQNRLLPYKVAPWNDIYPEFVDKDGAYTGLYIFSFGNIIYKASQTHKSSLPTTWPAFLDKPWHSALTLTYPNDDDAILYLFTLIIDKYGWEYMHRLISQNVKWVRGTATPSLLLKHSGHANATEVKAGINDLRLSFASSSAFAHGVSSVLPEDVYMAWPQSGAIFRTTTMPESAKLFLSFLLSDDWQKIITGSGFATRRSYDKLNVFKQKHMDPLGYGRFMEDRENVEAWRLQFEEFLGTPQGPNPIHLSF